MSLESVSKQSKNDDDYQKNSERKEKEQDRDTFKAAMIKTKIRFLWIQTNEKIEEKTKKC